MADEEKITPENEHEFLKGQYPKIQFKGKMVQFDPQKYTLEINEAVCCLDINSGKVKRGIIKHVAYSDPFRIPIYTIGRKTFMRHRVWPNTDPKFKKELRQTKKGALKKLTPKERRALRIAA